jgi:hypothetical protein
MPESRKTVFISCGQSNKEEIALGQQACELVKELTRFDGYFAQNQATLQALTENILSRLYESVGMIVIMHHRGKIEGYEINRASVWVEQEVAIASFMEQILNRRLYSLLFIQKGITLEGLRKYILFNAIEFTKSEEVITKLREILPTWKEPLYIGDEEKRTLVEEAVITAEVQTGFNFNITLLIGNFSNVDVEVKRVVFRSEGKRLCDPISAPIPNPWKIPATRKTPFQITAPSDLSGRLAGIYNKVFSKEQFRADLEVELDCEILGLRRVISDKQRVQVDYGGHQITRIL